MEVTAPDTTHNVNAALEKPTIIEVDPPQGYQGQEDLNVTITGQYTDFQDGVSEADFGGGITVNNPITVNERDEAVASTTIADDAVIEPRTVTVSTGTEVVSLEDGFTVNPLEASSRWVIPGSGFQGKTKYILIRGENTHFMDGISQADFGEGITVDSTTIYNENLASVSITIDPEADIGPMDVNVITDDEVPEPLINGFVVRGVSDPQIIATSPSSDTLGSTLDVHITGLNTHFMQGVSRADFGEGILVRVHQGGERPAGHSGEGHVLARLGWCLQAVLP